MGWYLLLGCHLRKRSLGRVSGRGYVYGAHTHGHNADAAIAPASLEIGLRDGDPRPPIQWAAHPPGWLRGPDTGFDKVGEETDRKTRAKMLDEGLDVLTGLWSGQPFSYSVEHYHVQDVTFSPTPLQSPRIPIWVVGAWPRMKSMRRVLRYDGVLPMKMNDDGSFAQMTPADIQTMKTFIDERRSQTTPFDIVMEGETPGDDREKAAAIVRPLAEAGVTWWLEAVWASPESQGGLEGMRTRIKQGPPRVD